MEMILLGVLLVAVMAFLFRGKRRSSRSSRSRARNPRNEIARLRERFFRKMRLARAPAEAALERHLAGLRRRFPDRDELWYHERVVSDLERDTR
jgi:hypothetical protein